MKAGAILPLNVASEITGLGDASMAGRRTIMIYPNGILLVCCIYHAEMVLNMKIV